MKRRFKEFLKEIYSKKKTPAVNLLTIEFNRWVMQKNKEKLISKVNSAKAFTNKFMVYKWLQS